ncbi:hypothetical protein V6N13_115368 [Hibiscus sabdariffa]
MRQGEVAFTLMSYSCAHMPELMWLACGTPVTSSRAMRNVFVVISRRIVNSNAPFVFVSLLVVRWRIVGLLLSKAVELFLVMRLIVLLLSKPIARSMGRVRVRG